MQARHLRSQRGGALKFRSRRFALFAFLRTGIAKAIGHIDTRPDLVRPSWLISFAKAVLLVNT